MGRIERRIGSDLFKEQLITGKSEEEIRSSWEPQLSGYKALRMKYTLYP